LHECRDGEKRDLVTEVSGRNPMAWSLNVIDMLFTSDELVNGVLVPSNRTDREALDPIRVAYMRAAMVEKYQYDEAKAEQVWAKP